MSVRAAGDYRRAAGIIAALLGLLSMLGPAAQAQVDATRWKSGTVDLSSGWREQDGDNLAWAASNFDDSGWPTVELDALGEAQPGWHWYRQHITLAPGHPHVHLLIAGGAGTYELYIDGKKAGGPELRTQFGVVRPVEEVFSISGDASRMTLALRTYAPTVYASWHLPLFLTTALGTPGAIGNEQQAMESQRLYEALPSIAINLALMLAAIGAFALYWSQRKHAEYLWLGFYLLLLGASNLLLSCVQCGLVPLALNNIVADPLVYLFTIAQIEFTLSFAGKEVSRPWRVYRDSAAGAARC